MSNFKDGCVVSAEHARKYINLHIADDSPRIWKIFCFGLLVGLFLGLLLVAVLADDLHASHPENLPMHEQFYSGWERLNGAGSCCNKDDCFPTEIRRIDGVWYALKIRAMTTVNAIAAGLLSADTPDPRDEFTNWVQIPEHTLEHNAGRADLGATVDRDPRDSPDGRNHACINGGHVICAVLGSGQ